MKRLAILLACALIIPGAALAQDVSTPPPTYKSPNGGILPTTGVATVGRDTGSGLPCWVGLTSTCGPSGGGPVTAVAGAYATGFSVDIGTKGDPACATDNGSCGLIALFARNNQRITSLITAMGSPFQAGGSIGNTSFGISGTLPAFASTPTVNAVQSGAYIVQPTDAVAATGSPATISTSGSVNIAIPAGTQKLTEQFSGTFTGLTIQYSGSMDGGTTLTVLYAKLVGPGSTQSAALSLISGGSVEVNVGGFTSVTRTVTISTGSAVARGNFTKDPLNNVVSVGNSVGTLNTPSSSATYAIVPTVTSAVASSLVLASGSHNGYRYAITTGASAGYFMVIDATSAPADGAVTPKICRAVAANTSLEIDHTQIPDRFSTGITEVFSTTGCYTKTASATAALEGQFQ